MCKKNMDSSKLCSCGDRPAKIKKKCKLHSVENQKEVHLMMGPVERHGDKEELFSVPRGPFKIFPRAYYRCVTTEDGDLVCFK